MANLSDILKKLEQIEKNTKASSKKVSKESSEDKGAKSGSFAETLSNFAKHTIDRTVKSNTHSSVSGHISDFIKKSFFGSKTKKASGGLPSGVGGGGAAAEGAEAAGGAEAGLAAGEATAGGVAEAGAATAAGTAATVVGVIVAVVAALVALIAVIALGSIAITKWAQGLLDSQRKYAEISPSQAVLFAKNDLRELFRDQRIGEATSGSTAKLSESLQNLYDAFTPIQIVLNNIFNSIASTLIDLITKLVELLVKGIDNMIDGINGMIKVINDILKKIPGAGQIDEIKGHLKDLAAANVDNGAFLDAGRFLEQRQQNYAKRKLGPTTGLD